LATPSATDEGNVHRLTWSGFQGEIPGESPERGDRKAIESNDNVAPDRDRNAVDRSLPFARLENVPRRT
jgi:hypothetical protein